MNIRKDIDYSAMFNAMDDVMAAGMTQMELYCELGRLICTRPEKGAAVAAAEHFKNHYQDVNGFSPRNMRRMRDFYRLYGEHSDLLALSLKIGWTQNVIILEADLNLDERRWYLRATAQFGWSKAELKQKIDSASHLEIDLDESANTCYTESKNTNLEPTTHEQDTLYLSWKYLQKPDGRVCNEGLGEESRAGEKIPDRVSSYKYRGNWQSGLSSGSSQTGGTWHQLFGQKSSSVIEQRLREVRSVDWHGQCQPSEYVQNMRGRLFRQNAPPDGFYRPPRRSCRSLVHRRFRGNMAECIGRLSGAA